jgi:tetratricopeptide (TPR) repeat protein
VGDVLSHLKRYDEAVPVLERSVAIYRQFAADKSNALNGPRSALGQAYVRVGRFADAVAALEPALAVDTGDEAQKRLALAQALWETGGDRRRAMTLAREAQALMTADASLTELRAEAETWLGRHAR